MKDYLNYFFRGILFASFVLCAQKASASHCMGADLSYRYVGGNSYEITLSFYRDCHGIMPEDSAWLVYSSSCFPAAGIFLNQDSGTGQEITPHCPSAITTCNGGNDPGIQQYIYRGIVTLPGACSNWNFSYEECCRNAAITNIIGPDTTAMHVNATLDNTVFPNNNSPTFSNLPVTFACLGQQFCYNHGAYDVDGDSLVFSPVTPKVSLTNSVLYSAPFSAWNPLTSNPLMGFTYSTGDICMTPTSPTSPPRMEVTVMAVLVKEYRQGLFIGSVERDIQITVRNCNNQNPALSGIDGSASVYAATTCAGTQTCFNIYSSDQDVGQNTFINWDHSIPAASFTVIPGARESASFCWTPTQADIRHNPYCFTASVHDDNCPLYGNQTYSYCIKVTGLNVDAGPNQSVGCNAYRSLTASAVGGAGTYSYLWNTGQTTSAITAGPGTYIVTASDGRCQNEDTVQVLPGISVPVADFSIAKTCTNLSVQFTNHSTIAGGTITGLHWHFGDGDTSNLPNPLHNYSATGTYLVTLIVRSLGGCIDTVVQRIDLNSNQPTAAFSFNNACVNAPVNFSNLSTSPSTIVSWLWRFGNAATSALPNTAHTYSTAGTYPVTLVMTNARGCVDSVTNLVTAFSPPNANAGLDQTICEGAYDTLTATGGTSYYWITGGAITPSIILRPPLTQMFIVSVTDSNSCNATDSVTIHVNPKPFAIAGNNHSICVGNAATLDGLGNGSYSWNPGGATTQQTTVSPVSSTFYILTVTSDQGCQSSDQTLVTVNPVPDADAGSDLTICSGDQVTLFAVGGANYLWQPGGATSSSIDVNPAATTVYSVLVSSGVGCRDSDQVMVRVNPVPAASFLNSSSGCENATIHFSDQSAISSGTISWNWNFGNGNSSALQNPCLVYSTPGNYVVNLVVTSDAGCRDSIGTVISIIPSPAASYDVVNACFQDSVQFINNTVISNGEALNYQWSFGDTSSSLFNNPSHYYSSHGTFYSTLLVTSASGCTDSASMVVDVYPLPPANAGSDQSICVGGAAILTASGGIEYAWNPVVSGSSSIIISPVSTQTYSVVVTDGNNCKASDDVLVTVNSNPVADAGDDQTICSGSSALLVGSGGVNYSWNPGGLSSPQISVNPTSTSSYALTVFNTYGCEATDQVLVTVNASPVADAGVDKSICFGNQVTFLGAGGGSYQWQPLGGSTSSITVAPQDSITYTLIVANTFGCRDTDHVSVTVNPLPAANFSCPSLGCHGAWINFSDQSTVSSGSISSWFWNFGNGTNSTYQNPVMNYPDSGTYAIHLQVTSNTGCKDSVAASITIIPSPDASFNANDVCLLHAVNFNNTSQIMSGEPLTYQWKFGDNSPASSLVSPSHAYGDYGNYNARLITTSSRGCMDSASKPIVIHALPRADFSSVSSCQHAPVFFHNESSVPIDAIGSWSWNFGDASISGIESPRHTYQTYGNFHVQLSVISNFGCKESVIRTQRINPVPVPDFTGEQKCFGDSIRFINRSSIPVGSIIRWQWFFGDQFNAYSFAPTHFYSHHGIYNVQLKAISDSGCGASVVLPSAAIIYPLPEAFFIPNTTAVDEIFPTVNFINQSMTAVTDLWDFGDGTFSSAFSPDHTYPNTGFFDVRLIVTDQNGCRDTSYSRIEVRPVANIFVPNAFTPNGDRVNDVFRAFFKNMVKMNTQIFDRWGVKVAEWNDLNGSWDGTTDGKQAPSDVYVYRLDYIDNNGKSDLLIGRVTLVR